MIKEYIEKQINILDYNWFQKIKKEFEDNELYVRETNNIKVVNVDSSNIQIEDFKDGLNYEYTVDFFSYAYLNVIADSKHLSMLHSTGFACLSGSSILDRIKMAIENNLKNIDQIKEKHLFLLNTYNYIDEGFDSFLEGINSDKLGDIYKKTVKYIKEKTLNEFENYYSDIFNVIDEIVDKDFALRFDINQNELAALLILLQEANIINDRESKLSLNQFASRNFLFKDSLTNEYKLAKLVHKKMSEQRNNPSSLDTPLESIFSKLLDAKNKLTN